MNVFEAIQAKLTLIIQAYISGGQACEEQRLWAKICLSTEQCTYKMDFCLPLCLFHQQVESQQGLHAADLLFSSSRTGLCSDPEGVVFKPCSKRKALKNSIRIRSKPAA